MTNFYNIRIGETFLNYMGVVHIITEISKKWVVHVNENGVVYKEERLKFIDEFRGFRYYKLKRNKVCDC